MKHVCVEHEGGVNMLRSSSKSVLSNGTFCNGRNTLYLHFPIRKLLITCGYRALENMWWRKYILNFI